MFQLPGVFVCLFVCLAFVLLQKFLYVLASPWPLQNSPSELLTSCLLGLSPKQVHWVNHISQLLLGCAFFSPQSTLSSLLPLEEVWACLWIIFCPLSAAWVPTGFFLSCFLSTVCISQEFILLYFVVMICHFLQRQLPKCETSVITWGPVRIRRAQTWFKALLSLYWNSHNYTLKFLNIF